MVNIDLIDASCINRRNGPSHSMFANAFGKYFAALRGKQLGIAQPANAIAGIENDRGRDYRPEKGSAANFIHAGD
jgi:hypothetical protein